MTELKLYNSLTRQIEPFRPADPKNVRMYVCGPTVYDRAHLGNARAVVVYDVLFRLLRHIYGEEHVTYVRNITDVDDKIITAARERNIPIDQLTREVTDWFHTDMAALNCLPPTIEPKATAHIAEMITMIGRLIDNGNAYERDGHVLFDVASNPDYGALSGRKLEDLIAGARVDVAAYKRNPGDFVLWKPGNDGDDASSLFNSPWGKGRPGWHIECSAMATRYLGETFDLHGGGADLKFPHHENEIAQSRCALPGSQFAKVWVHNGFLTVNGEKMSKSLGNFATVRDVINRFEAKGKGHKAGEVIRLALLSTRYSDPLNWTEKLLDDAEKMLDGWYRGLSSLRAERSNPEQSDWIAASPSAPRNDGGNLDESYFLQVCGDNLNTAHAIHVIDKIDNLPIVQNLLGVLLLDPELWFKGVIVEDDGEITALIQQRIDAKKARDFAKADALRQEIEAMGIVLEDKRDGTTDWRRA